MKDQKCAEVFNNCFNSYFNPIIAALHKYKRHPSILKIKEKGKNMTLFLLIMFTPIKYLKLSKILTLRRLLSKGDIPVRIIKENKFTFSKCYLRCLTFTLTITLFLIDLRRLILSLFIGNLNLLIKLIIDPLVFYMFYLKLLSAASMIKFMNILILY